MTPPLRVGGLTPLTTIDYPGALSAVVFLQGCPWRCGYCHNQHLLPVAAAGAHSWDSVRDFLVRRRGLLDAVVFSGGEPTLQLGLAAAAAEVRALGFRVGLHSAGIDPRRLAPLLGAIDWIGLDIKGPARRYDAITGARRSGARARAALDHVLRSGVAHECRTTWHAGLFPQEELLALGHELLDAGVRHWAVQRCGTADRAALAELLAPLQPRFASLQLR